MAKNIFKDDGDFYTNRFIKKQGKELKFPTFKYLDIGIHPKYKDHIVVLSENKFPKNTNMTFCWDNSVTYMLTNMHDDEMYKPTMTELVEEAELEMEREQREKGLNSGRNMSQRDKGTKKKESPAVAQASKILEETKGLGLDEYDDFSSSSDSYEGGESDSEEQKSTKSKKVIQPLSIFVKFQS